jgi:uncharacterized protein YukE
MAGYESYSSALQDLDEQLATAEGRYGNAWLVGSEGASLSMQKGALEQQRQVDPWGFYRGSAADELAKYASPSRDPSNIYRSRLRQMMLGEFSPSDPSYQWRFDQGQQAVERSLAARGLLNSGNAAIELQQYGQGAASQEYQAQFYRILQAMTGVENQYDSQMNRLMELAGIDNVGAYLQKQKQDQEAADNANYQMGLARAMNKQESRNQPFGAGAL